MKTTKILSTNAETNDCFTTLLLEDVGHLYVLENVGMDLQSVPTATYGSYAELLDYIKGKNDLSVVFCPDYVANVPVPSCAFQHLMGIDNQQHTEESIRHQRVMVFADEYIGWSQNHRNIDISVDVSFPCRELLFADAETSSEELMDEEVSTIVKYIHDHRQSLAMWVFENLPTYVGERSDLMNDLRNVFCAIPNADRNAVLYWLRSQEPQSLYSLGLTADYFGQIAKYGKDGTISALSEQLSTEAKKFAENGSNDVLKGIDDIVAKIHHRDRCASSVANMRKGIRDWVDEWQSGDYLPTNITFNDGRTMAFTNCGTSVIVAPTKNGKTTFMIDCAIKLAEGSDDVVLFLTAEETGAQVNAKIMRHYAADYDKLREGSGVLQNLRKWRAAELGSVERRAFDDITAIAEGKVGNLLIDELSEDIDVAVAQMRECVDSVRRRGKKVSAVFVDYIQRFRKVTNSYSRTDELAYICASIDKLAHDLQIGIITGAQFSRKAKECSPNDWGAYMISESQSVENLATDVYLLAYSGMNRKWIEGEAEFDSRVGRMQNCGLKEFFYLESIVSRENQCGGWQIVPVDMAFGVVGNAEQVVVDNTGDFGNVDKATYNIFMQ